MKRFTILLLSLSLLLASCSNTLISRDMHEQIISSAEHNSPSDYLNADVADANVGGEDYCFVHNFTYHSIETTLANYVGQDRVVSWLDSLTEPDSGNIVNFIAEFSIPKETFIEVVRAPFTDEFFNEAQLTPDEYFGVYSYSDEQIDAIYSHVNTQISRAFCGPLAFVNEADGELYSIYWLAEHTPEEYVEAGLPMEEVEAVIEKAASEEFGLSEIAESAMSKMTKALALAEENSSIK